MHFLPLIYLVPFAALVTGQDTNLGTVKKIFDAANVPSDLRLPFNPRALLEVTMPQTTGPPITLHAGIHLPRNSTVGPPTFGVIGPIGGGPFVVAAVDLDAPSPENRTNSEVRHLLAPDFTTRRLSNSFQPLTNSTPAISPYRQPNPTAGTHRYVFLLFNQPPGFDNQMLVTPTTPIQMFNLSSFAAATGLGAPIAGTFMLVAPNPVTQ